MKKDRMQAKSAKSQPRGVKQPHRPREGKATILTSEVDSKTARDKLQVPKPKKKTKNMGSTATPAEQEYSKSEAEILHTNRQLLALAQVAQAVQRAHTTEEVYQAIQKEMTELGYKATVFELDNRKKSLRIAYLFYDSRLVRKAEKMAGLTLSDYRIKPRAESLYQQVLTGGDTVYIVEPARAVADSLPKALRILAEPFAEIFHLSSCCFAPLNVEDKTFGILAVTGADLSEADTPAITILANQTAIALQNAWLYEKSCQEISKRKKAEEEIQQRNEDLIFLNSINAAINRGENLDSLTPFISKEAARIFNSNGATLHLVDANRQILFMQNLSLPPALAKYVEKVIRAPIPQIAHDLNSNHPYRSILISGKSKILNDIDSITEFTSGFLSAVRLPEKMRSQLRKLIPDIVKLLGYRSVLVVPLISGREVIGTLDMGRHELFTEEDARRLESIARQLTIAIQRKRAEETLQESEEKFRKAFMTSPDSVSINRLEDGLFISVNQGFTQIMGYTKEDVLGKTVFELQILENPEDWNELIEGLRKDGVVNNLEASFKTKGGSTKYSLVSAGMIDLGGIPHILSIARDITERKKAEEDLQQSEALYRTLLENVQVGVGISESNGKLVTFNDAMLLPGGYQRADLEKINSVADLYYNPQDRQQVLDILVKQGLVSDFPIQFKRKDGTPYDAMLWLTPLKYMGKPCVQAVVQDVTERKQAEKKIREGEERYRLLAENATDVIWTMDMNLWSTYTSPSVLRLRGFSSEEAMNQSLEKALTPESYKLVYEALEEELAKEKIPGDDPYRSLTLELETIHKDGSTIWIESTMTFLRDPEGKPIEILGVSRDITRRKKTEGELRQRAEELAALQATVLEMTTEHDPEVLLQSIVERAVYLLKAEGGGLYLCNPEKREARCMISYNLSRNFSGIVLKYGEGAAGTVAETGQPLRIDDYRKWPGRASTFDDEQPFRALVSAPMRWQDQVTGVIHVLRSKSDEKFTVKDQELLALFANHASIAFENAHLFEQVEQRLRESESLGQASQALSGFLEIQPLLENILEAARRAIPAAEKGTIMLKGVDERLRIRAMSGYFDQNLLDLVLKPEEGFVSRVFAEQKPVCLDDVQQGFRVPYGGQFEEMKTVRSAIAAPLTVKGVRIGVISLDNTSRTSAFTKDDLHLMASFASSAAVAIHNANLFDQTRRRARLLTTLHEVSQKISNLFDLQSIAEIIIPTIENLLGWSRGSLWLADEDGNPRMLIHSTTGFKGKAKLQELERLKTLVSHPGEGIIGWSIQHGEIIRSGNVIEDDRYVMGSPDIRSELCAPLMLGNKCIGCINFESMSENAFSEEDEQVLSTLAGEIAGAIERARLFGQTRRRADELGALAQVSAALRIATTRSEMIPVILNQITEILQIEDAALLSHDPISGENLVEMGCGKWAHATGQLIEAGEGIGDMIAETRRPFLSDNIKEDKRFTGLTMFQEPEAVAGSPLLVQKQFLGSLWVGRCTEAGQQARTTFTAEELRLLGSIADMTANAIHRAHLHERTVRHAEQMVAVNEIGHMLSETLDLEEVYSRLTGAILNLLPDVCSIFISLYDKRTQNINCTSAILDGVFLDVKEIPSQLIDPGGNSRQSRVLLSGEPLIADNLSASLINDPRLKPEGEQKRKPESALYVAMHSKDSPIGLIQVQSYKPDSFGQEEVNLLSLVANTAAITIENARLFAETEKRLRYISALHNIDAAIGASVDLRVTLDIILENVSKELKVDAASIALMNPYSKTLEYTASRGFRTRIIDGMRIRLGESLAGQAAIQRRMVGIADIIQREPDLFSEEKFVAQFAVPLIAKGQVHGVLQVFHRSSLETDMDWINFLNTLAGQAAIAMDNANLFYDLQRSNLELTLAYDATIQGWSQAMELRDKETQGHADRVTALTMQLAREMDLSDVETVHLRRGVLLHDIGKMGIPDHILLKPGPLTAEEWEIMRMHPIYAYDMLSSISYLHQALDVPYSHHEKWDGSGYPRGLKGEQIPLAGRIFAVVDVFDALTSDRPYRKAWSRDQALGYLREQSGKHFDPQVVDIFLKLTIE